MHNNLSINDLQSLIQERVLTIKRNDALLFENNLILENYKAQKNKIAIPQNKSIDVRSLRRRISCDEERLREVEKNLNVLKQKLEQTPLRRGRPIGCSDVRFKLTSDIFEFRRRIKSCKTSIQLKLQEINKQSDMISQHQFHLEYMEDKLMTFDDSVDNITLDNFTRSDVEIGSNVDSLDISDLSLQVPVYSESCECNDQTGSDGLIDDDGDEEENHVHIYSDPPDPKIKGCIRNEMIPSNKSIKNVSVDPLVVLLDASLNGELEQVMKFTKLVDNPSASNGEGITALHNASLAGHIDIVQFLINIPCNINIQDNNGWTALHCAAACNNLPMIRELVEHGAAVLICTRTEKKIARDMCESREYDFEKCSNYLLEVQNNIGVVNGGVVYALFDYVAVNKDELSFCENDKIQVLERENQWWMATLIKTRETGYIPYNLIGIYPTKNGSISCL